MPSGRTRWSTTLSISSAARGSTVQQLSDSEDVQLGDARGVNLAHAIDVHEDGAILAEAAGVSGNDVLVVQGV